MTPFFRPVLLNPYLLSDLASTKVGRNYLDSEQQRDGKESLTRAYNEARGMKQQTWKKEICIAEVIAPNAGDQRCRTWAPLSDRNNKNPSSDLLVLLRA